MLLTSVVSLANSHKKLDPLEKTEHLNPPLKATVPLLPSPLTETFSYTFLKNIDIFLANGTYLIRSVNFLNIYNNYYIIVLLTHFICY